MNISRKIGEQTNKFIIKVACKIGVFCSANDLDVETDQELGRVNKMIPRERLTGQNWRGREGDEKKYLLCPSSLSFPIAFMTAAAINVPLGPLS